MKDLLVDRERWVVVNLGTKMTNMSKEDCDKFERRVRSTTQICLAYFLLNVLVEDNEKRLCEKLGNLYHSKSLVKTLFLQKKLYLLRMNAGDYVIEHINAFNIMVS